MRRYQRLIIAFFTFIGGLYFFLEFILPKSINGFEFGFYQQEFLKGLQVVSVMAIGLGLLSIFKLHSKNIFGQKKGWVNSLVLLTGFILMLIFQGVVLFDERGLNGIKKKLDLERKFLVEIDKERATKPVQPRLEALNRELNQVQAILAARLGAGFKESVDFDGLKSGVTNASETFTEAERQALDAKFSVLSESLSDTLDKDLEKSFSKRATNLFNEGFFVPLGSAMFALLAFYVANAAYRSFRVRSLESFLLMAAAVIVMLGQIPQGPMYISEDLPAIRLWLLKNINTAAFRAIFFGSSIAGLAMAIRIWFSLERGPLDESEIK